MQVKKIALSTLLIFNSLFLLFRERAPNQTASQLTLGDLSSSNHIVLFEEFACPACNDFFHEHGPWLLNTFVKKGKATLSIVPLALFESSLPAARATTALIAFRKELVYPFMDFVFSLPRDDFSLFTEEELLKTFEIQENHPLSSEIYSYIKEFSETDIEKNIRWIERVEGDVLEVPSLFVNGKRIYPLTRENIVKSLESL